MSWPNDFVIVNATMVSDASLVSVDLGRTFRRLFLEVPTFAAGATAANAMITFAGANNVAGTFRVIHTINPSSALTGPTVPAQYGIGTTAGNLIVNVSELGSFRYLQILTNTTGTAGVGFKFLGQN